MWDRVKGWLLVGASIALLGQFSVYGHYEAQDALAAWADEIENHSQLAYDTTTYADDRIVYKVASVLDTNIVGTDTSIFYAPDLTGAPTGARGEALWKSNSDSVMIVTGDTFNLAQLDSATATAVAAAWGVRDPYTVDLAWHTPPPTSNEPAGFVQGTYMVFSDTFNAPDNDWDRNNGTPLSVIVVDGTRDSVGRMYYEADATSGDTMSGTAPDNWYFKTTTGGIDSLQSDSLYVSYYLKLSSGWQGQDAGVNKTLYVSREGSASAPVYYSAQGTDDGALLYQVRLQGLTSQVMPGNQGANDTIYRDQWHFLEHLHVLNTLDGVADGITKVWIDGTLTHSYTNSELWNDDGDGRWWASIKWNPVWGGGTSDSLEADQYQYVDDIYVSGNDNS